ncbi:DUF21-domain-containing protein [Clavulina sp. PMI_390]|nr:DUF21-domain-containing protein [Clavulina sp. PMI_390]
MSHRVATYVALARVAAQASPVILAEHKNKHKDYPAWGTADFYWHIGISVILVLLGGVFAGLTLGLMGLDELHLRVLKSSSDDPAERENAAKVLRVLRRGRHWVLVVLLLGNVIVNESLPIFLDNAIGGGLGAVIISTVMIVIFGEIIPQALSTRYGLQIGAKCSGFVLGLMYLFAPIAWPIAKLLDLVLGHDDGGNHYKKAELKSFLQFHRQGEEPLRDDEITILNGVLSLNDKKVDEIMTPMKDVVTISSDAILDHKMVDHLLLTGYSRFPVHDPEHRDKYIGLLLIKKLIAYDPELKLRVSSIPLSILPEAKRSINCFQALDYFQTGRAHLLLISDHPGEPRGAVGVVTLEDIIEEIIEEEIIDETDRYESNQSKRRAKRMSTAAVMKGIVEHERRRYADDGGTASNPQTPFYRPRTIDGQQNANAAADTSLRTTATESSALLRGPPIIESPTTERSSLLFSNGSPEKADGASNGDSNGYGATGVSSSPPQY